MVNATLWQISEQKMPLHDIAGRRRNAQITCHAPAQCCPVRYLLHGATQGLHVVEQHEQQEETTQQARHAIELLDAHQHRLQGGTGRHAGYVVGQLVAQKES